MDSAIPVDPANLPAASSKTIALNLPLEEQAGDRIGPYQVLQKIGEGGCGIVYMAEQHEPVRRRVALKVIKLGMDTREVIARFEAERQALALMDHPNIAKVLDAGATMTGRPYFVMELVKGIKITDYCDQHKLPTQDRLTVFIQVCQAIQHAHQKGIIHRDIKPSNVLVSEQDGIALPKVIDFGIAKATHGRLTDQTIFTAFEQFIGTPAYMSPEQAEMSSLDIDTRSDIYSLGVLLYELLTGKTPFDPKELLAAGIDGLRKILREKDPPQPSTRLNGLNREEITTTAQRRRADPPKLISSIRGDLDWVVMKCIEKDRSMRYETANALAMDLRRFLGNEPVLARPPSQAYRLKKAVQRHRVAFASGAAIFVSLLLALFMTSRSLRIAQAARSSETRQRQIAEQEQAQAQLSEEKARQAEAKQAELRQRAEQQEHQSRLRAYASDMNLAQQALAIHNLGRAQELLKRQHPGTGENDLRNWEWRYLWRQCQSDALFTLCQQSNAVQSLAVSQDGRFLAAGEQENGGASVWDLRSRKELGRLAPRENRVQLAFSPTQDYLACSSSAYVGQGRETNRVRIWNAATHQPVTEFGLDGLCLGLRFAADGKTLVTATAGPGNHITLWQIPEGTKRASFVAGQAAGSIGTPFTAAGDLSVAFYRSDDAQQVCALDLNSGSKLWQTKVSDEGVTSLALSPNGSLVAVGTGILDSAIRLLDARTGKEVRRLEGHRGYVIALAFTSDGKTLLSGSADQTIRLWDLSEEHQQAPARVLQGHQLEVWSLAVVEGSTMLVSGSKDGSINVWDTTTAEREQAHRVLPMRCDVWSFAGDARSIVTVGFDGQVLKWHGDTFSDHEPVVKLSPNALRRCISSDGRLIASAERSGTVAVWDLPQKRLVREIAVPGRPMAPVQISADGSKMALVQLNDLSIHMWDLKNWQEIPVELHGFKEEIVQNGDAGALSADGRWAFLVAGRGAGWLWNSENGQMVTLALDVKQPSDAAFSADGTIFAVASRLGYVRLWETATRREVATLRGVLLGIHSVAFSPDGHRLAAGSNGQEAIKLWDLGSQQELLTLEGEGSVFQSASFSPDGNAIGALNSARTLNVWLTPSWKDIESAEK